MLHAIRGNMRIKSPSMLNWSGINVKQSKQWNNPWSNVDVFQGKRCKRRFTCYTMETSDNRLFLIFAEYVFCVELYILIHIFSEREFMCVRGMVYCIYCFSLELQTIEQGITYRTFEMALTLLVFYLMQFSFVKWCYCSDC